MTDPNAPIYGYNEQYFRLKPKYTKKELYELQAQVLKIISKGSDDIRRDLNSDIDEKIIRSVLMQCWRRDLIQKKSNRFFTK